MHNLCETLVDLTIQHIYSYIPTLFSLTQCLFLERFYFPIASPKGTIFPSWVYDGPMGGAEYLSALYSPPPPRPRPPPPRGVFYQCQSMLSTEDRGRRKRKRECAPLSPRLADMKEKGGREKEKRDASQKYENELLRGRKESLTLIGQREESGIEWRMGENKNLLYKLKSGKWGEGKFFE